MNSKLNPVIIIGSALAVGSGVLSYFAGGNNVVLGVLIGIEVQILTLATEILLSIKARAAVVGRLARVIDEIEGIPWMPPLLTGICEAANSINERYRSTIAPNAAQRLLATTERELRQLESGILFVDCYDPTLKLELLAGPPSVLRAMSVQSHDLQWHLSDVGKNYWRAQVGALARGWTIRRVFVYENWVEELQQLASQQKSAGVTVMRVRRTSLPESLKNLDVTVWGDRYAFEHQKMTIGTTTVDKFTVASEDIREYLARFRTLEALAERL